MLIRNFKINRAAEFEATRVRSSFEERLLTSSKDDHSGAGCSQCE